MGYFNVKVQDQENIHPDFLLYITAQTMTFEHAKLQINTQLKFNNLPTTGYKLTYYDAVSHRQTSISNEQVFRQTVQVLGVAQVQDRLIQMCFPPCQPARMIEMMGAKITFLEEKVKNLEAENERLRKVTMGKDHEEAPLNVPTKRERE